MDINVNPNANLFEFQQLISDVTNHLKNDLQTYDYQNTLKNSQELLSQEKSIRELLERCEKNLEFLKSQNFYNSCDCCDDKCTPKAITGHLDKNKITTANQRLEFEVKSIPVQPDSSYLDMNAKRKSKYDKPSDYVDFNQTIRSSSLEENDLKISDDQSDTPKISKQSISHEQLKNDSEKNLYDFCNISSTASADPKLNHFSMIIDSTTNGSPSIKQQQKSGSRHKRVKSFEEIEPILNCPYMKLSLCNLFKLNKSTKTGQLIRIEKRFLFDQTRKYFCGIINDWLLCYNNITTDGSNNLNNSNNSKENSNSSLNNCNINQLINHYPLLCINLLNCDVEHYGEGKRRDLSFQITNQDSTKKFIFQSTNDIETKEWIHAIEASIRGFNNFINHDNLDKIEMVINFNNNLRKLPTPPSQLKEFNIKFHHDLECLNHTVNHIDNNCNGNEDIYEEPNAIFLLNSDNDDSNKSFENNNFDVNESPPNLPSKIKKIKDNHISESYTEYDVPKLNQLSDGLNDIHNQPESSSKLLLVEDKTSCAKQSGLKICSKTEFQSKIKDVQNKLSKLPTKSPITKDHQLNSKKSLSHNKSSSPSKSNFRKSPDKVNKSPKDEKRISNPTSTPVKTWFLNRLSKATASNSNSPVKINKEVIQRDKDDSKELENLLNDNLTDSMPKEGKVNMIINQLEANGHFPIFAKKTDRSGIAINSTKTNNSFPDFNGKSDRKVNDLFFEDNKVQMINESFYQIQHDDENNYEPIMNIS